MQSLMVLNSVILLVSLIALAVQFMRPKMQKMHILFAIFCGSVAILMTKLLTATSISPYHYLIGMGACALCNTYWLLARVFFRRRTPIKMQHISVAIAIALLVMLGQGYYFLNGIGWIAATEHGFIRYSLVELTILLSSCILVLTFWEGCRGFQKDSREGKAQRLWFLTTFATALVGSKIAAGIYAGDSAQLEFIISLITLFVLVNTQVLMTWKTTNRLDFIFKDTLQADLTRASGGLSTNPDQEANNPNSLFNQVKDLMINQSLYLQENLKVADIARQLNVPEYRISKAIKEELNTANFNQFVNMLRIEHSLSLFKDPNNQKKSVLEICYESGFASVGPFTRAFKAITGSTPSEYRQQRVE